MDEGSTEGAGGLTAASDLREAITLRTLASDCTVFDDASLLISEKERRHMHRNPPSCYMHQMLSVTQYLHVFSVYKLLLG